MARDPAFLFYSSDFLTGVIDMTMEERGQYITLMCLQHQKGHLSAETIRFCVGSVSDKVLTKYRQDEEGLYFNKRLDTEIDKRESFVGSRQKNGAKGGRPPKAKTDRFSVGYPTENLHENENENENVIESEGDIEDITPRARKKSPKKDKVFPPEDKAFRAAAYLDECIRKRLPDQKPADDRRLQSWADAFDKCHRIDGQSWETIGRVLKFSQEDQFWQQNILSGTKFREKFVQLLSKMQAHGEPVRKPSASASAMNDLQTLHAMFSEEDDQ